MMSKEIANVPSYQTRVTGTLSVKVCKLHDINGEGTEDQEICIITLF
jgi:hypothetical protein